MIEFEWDPTKAKTNLRKHRVSFHEAATVFHDPLGITVSDPDHSDDEDRYITIGVAATDRILMVSHTDRGKHIRIISARELMRTEREEYEDEIERRKS